MNKTVTYTYKFCNNTMYSLLSCYLFLFPFFYFLFKKHYITYSNVFAYRIYHATLLFTHY